ncbi:hypothetical protein L9F63_004625, partial [Diploptera punctata]
ECGNGNTTLYIPHPNPLFPPPQPSPRQIVFCLYGVDMVVDFWNYVLFIAGKLLTKIIAVEKREGFAKSIFLTIELSVTNSIAVLMMLASASE